MAEVIKTCRPSQRRLHLAGLWQSDRRARRKQAAKTCARYRKQLAVLPELRLARKRHRDLARLLRIRQSRQKLVKPTFEFIGGAPPGKA